MSPRHARRRVLPERERNRGDPHGTRARPDRRGQREQPQARARRAPLQGLPHGRGRYRRGRGDARGAAQPRSDPDGLSIARYRRHRGIPAHPRSSSHRAHSHHRDHFLRDARGGEADEGSRVRPFPDQADQREGLRPSRGGRPGREGAQVTAKVLVVDDTPMNVKMLADVLAFKGHQVVTAAGGREALAKIEAELPDLVLLDVMMPDLDGYAVCRAIRANPETTILPVVMVTALNPSEERV